MTGQTSTKKRGKGGEGRLGVEEGFKHKSWCIKVWVQIKKGLAKKGRKARKERAGKGSASGKSKKKIP